MMFKARILSFMDDIRSSYWFVPSLMALLAVGLSQFSLFIDRSDISHEWLDLRLLYTGSAEGARSILSTIASSMIGIAGVVFSITMVTLALASKQFGPRLLRNFMRDRGAQVVLGTFVSAFLFCLLILRQLQGEDASSARFIPQISMLFAVAFALAGLGVLIYYIHHIAASIQTTTILEELGQELKRNLQDLYPRKIGSTQKSREDQNYRTNFESRVKAQRSYTVRAPRDGYIRRIDPELLMKTAEQFDLLIYNVRRPGDFVSSDDAIFRIWPEENLSDNAKTRLHFCYKIGHQRTQEQDARFTIEQLVGIALMALSPSVNDPFTAILVIDRLGACLSFVGQRDIPSRYRADQQGQLRLVTHVYNFETLTALCFDQIRLNSKGQLAVFKALLGALSEISLHVDRPEDQEVLLKHAHLVRDLALQEITNSYDREQIENQFQAFSRVMRGAVSELPAFEEPPALQ